MSEGMWMERAQAAEATLSTLKQASEAAIERVKQFKSNFGVKERSNGEIVVDFPKFAVNIGHDAAMDLKQIINDVYKVEKES